jgi:hypothetical protein
MWLPEIARRLFLAAANANVKADHAVLITRADHREIPVDVVLSLDNLL